MPAAYHRATSAQGFGQRTIGVGVEEIDSGEPNGTTDKIDAHEAGLRKALEAERAKRQEIATELAKLREAQEAAKRKAAEEAGEHKRLYDEIAPKYESAAKELEAYRAREAARMERLAARNAERVETLPEHLKALVPTGFDPESLNEWLDKAGSIADEKRPAGVQTGRVGKEPIPPHIVEEAKRLGIDPEVWFNGGAKLRKYKT